MTSNLQSRLEAARQARRPRLPTPAGAREALESATADRTPEAGDPEVIDLSTLRAVRAAARRVWNPAVEAPEPPPPAPSARTSVTMLLQRQAALRGEAVPTRNPLQDPCPNCGGAVRLDLYDLVESVAHLTCVDCGFLFTARSPRA